MLDLAWPVALTDRQLEQFSIFHERLLEWNRWVNLTAITDEVGVYVKHFYDSLMAVTTESWRLTVGPGTRVIDVGTGAGFPGIPLAIACPEVEFVLCDSLKKRVAFLEVVVESLGLENVQCIHARSEDLAHQKGNRASFQIALSRAVARLNVLVELMTPFLVNGGVALCYKGPNVEAECQDVTEAARILRCRQEPIEVYTLPFDLGLRSIVPFRQFGPMPAAYPRKAGIPEKEPLL